MGEISALAARFRRFAEQECRGSSPLYEQLSLGIADDGELLSWCRVAGEGQPVPNLLLGAVHFLLLRGSRHPLREYYPSLAEQPRPPEEALGAFREFCAAYRQPLTQLLQSRKVQTNEVRRCAYLLPSFSHIHQLSGKPLALVEIGTSAGLLLLWDKYRYQYGHGEAAGEPASPVLIRAEIRGGRRPLIPRQLPPVARRIGLDRHLVDLRHEEDALWLQALIWPEHHDRRRLFRQAVEALRQHHQELHMLEGDGISLLPGVARQVPAGCALVVFHTHVANQFSPEDKRRLREELLRIGQEREIYHLYNNMEDYGRLYLETFRGGDRHRELLAHIDGHGRWFAWEASEKRV